MESDLKLKIREAAYRLFKEISYSKTSVSDIAFAAGIGKGTVYLHYKNKEDLLSDVIDLYIIQPHRESLEFYESPEISLNDKLDNFIDIMLEALADIKALMFGSFDNVHSKTLREIFLNYSNYVEMFVMLFSGALKSRYPAALKDEKILSERLADFFNLLTGRVILYLFEEDWDNLEPIKGILKRIALPLFNMMVLNIKEE